MSAKDDLPSKQKGFQLGIDGYMVKPIELDELLLRVRALLRRANIEAERKIAVGNTVYTRKKIRAVYEKPLHSMAEAAGKVAQGDFSVYVPPLHTTDKLDYLDVMIMDFNKMVEELGSIETLKTDFVSNVSHEMKTPIAAIKNYAELLQMEHVTEETRAEYAESIENAAGV
ncbi:MAG: hypothetical protein NC312_12115 [Bacteroides fragilis]|nr:hypothetical protein [Bacteroides fragilis]